jgi:hypothetical protein
LDGLIGPIILEAILGKIAGIKRSHFAGWHYAMNREMESLFRFAAAAHIEKSSNYLVNPGAVFVIWTV